MTTDHNEAMSQLPHKLATLIQCLPQAPYRDHLAAECIKQAERIAELDAENGKLRDGLAKGLSEKTMITELAMRNGGLYAGIEGGAAAVLASAFAEQFTSSGGVNYVEVSFMHPATGPICVTLQRVQGKTPHQLCREAEAERDQLRAEVERLRADGERLDWIEHQYLEDLVMGLAIDCEHDGQYYVSGDDNKTGYGDSLRDALDAARTTHKETE